MSDTRKPWITTVTLEIEVPVVASSAAEAEALGRKHVKDEIDGSLALEDAIAVAHATAHEFTPQQKRWAGCLAHGVADDDPGRDRPLSKWL